MTNPLNHTNPRFSTTDYHRMLEAGILRDGEPVELLAGEVYIKAREGETWPRRRRFAPHEIRKMRQACLLTDGESTAGLEGDVREAASMGSDHWAAVNRLTRLLTEHLGRRAIVSVQCSVVLDEASEPEPDLAVIAGREDFYRSGKPRPEDVLLLIEVADTSYLFDREMKLPLYARAGVVEVWIVDLGGRRIDAYRVPSGNGYSTREVCGPGGRVAPRMLADLEVAVDEVLP